MERAQPMRRLAVPFAAIVLLCSAVGHAQETQPGIAAQPDPWQLPSNEEIRKVLADRMSHNGVGMVVGVIDAAGPRIVTYGQSDSRGSRPLDGDTVFQIGSLTKVFTGLLLADMVQRGEVGIDDPAAKYLPPGVTMPQRGRPITLIDLSKHWSALPSMPTNFSLDARPNPYEAYTTEQLYEFLSGYQLPREPGKQVYSNFGVALLGRLLARQAGMEYEPLLEQRVLAPLGLASTSIKVSQDQQRRLAPGHDRYLEPVETWNLLAMPASGSLRSSANDLLRFLAFNLGLRDTPLKVAMEYQRVPGRSLGWGRSTMAGETVYGHDGGKEGYRSAAIFNPRTQTGVVVLMNARTDDRPIPVAQHLLYRKSPIPPPTRAPDRPKIAPLDATALDAYAGEYRLESGDTLRIARREQHLLVDYIGGGIGTFFASGPQTFFCNTADEQIEFHKEGARVTGLTLTAEGKPERAVRTPPAR